MKYPFLMAPVYDPVGAGICRIAKHVTASIFERYPNVSPESLERAGVATAKTIRKGWMERGTADMRAMERCVSYVYSIDSNAKFEEFLSRAEENAERENGIRDYIIKNQGSLKAAIENGILGILSTFYSPGTYSVTVGEYRFYPDYSGELPFKPTCTVSYYKEKTFRWNLPLLIDVYVHICSESERLYIIGNNPPLEVCIEGRYQTSLDEWDIGGDPSNTYFSDTKIERVYDLKLSFSPATIMNAIEELEHSEELEAYPEIFDDVSFI